MRSSQAWAVIGNVLYHFDRALFGLLTPFLAPLFFPHSDPLCALIYMYAMIPLGSVSKLFGVMVFGRLSERIGQAKTLSITLMAMAIQTAIMGSLPTYQEVGQLAPVLLLSSRLCFDFFSAGQTTGGALLLLEKTQEEKRGIVSSLFDASGILGILLASLSVWLTSEYETFWRVLFWIGACIGIAGWIMRKGPHSEKPLALPAKPTWKILYEHRSSLLAITAVSGFSYANYYFITSFMNGFLPLISSISRQEALSLNTLLLGIDMVLLPVFGMLCTKIRKEKLMFLAIVGIMGSVVPFLFLLQSGTMIACAVVRITLTIFGICLAAPYHAWAYEKAPEQHKYLIGAMGSLLGSKLIGAQFTVVSLWLYRETDWIVAPGLLLVAIGFFAAGELKKESRDHELTGNTLDHIRKF